MTPMLGPCWAHEDVGYISGTRVWLDHNWPQIEPIVPSRPPHLHLWNDMSLFRLKSRHRQLRVSQNESDFRAPRVRRKASRTSTKSPQKPTKELFSFQELGNFSLLGSWALEAMSLPQLLQERRKQQLQQMEQRRGSTAYWGQLVASRVKS